MKRLLALAAMPLVLAATLSACAESEEPDTTLSAPTLEASEDIPESTRETTPEETFQSAPADEYEDVDPELFNLGGAYVVGGSPESGVIGCMAKPDTDYPFNCQVDFTYPVPPAEELGGASAAISPNIVSMSESAGRFITAFSPGSQGYFEPPRPLELGQRVSIDGATITHLTDGGFRVEYQGDAFEVHEGVYARDGEIDEALAAASQSVEAGTQCGSTSTPAGGDVAVVASQNDTTCGVAMQVMRGYITALREGQTEGQAAFWTAPNGWGCFGRWFFPGEDYVGANGKLACGAQDPSGKPAQEGSGEVVGLALDERDRL